MNRPANARCRGFPQTRVKQVFRLADPLFPLPSGACAPIQ